MLSIIYHELLIISGLSAALVLHNLCPAAVPSLLDAIINVECALLLFGLYR